MAKKLWIIERACEVVILSETREGAIKEGESLHGTDMGEPSYRAQEMTYLPDGWDGTCMPFGQEGDDTIDTLVAAGAAESYRAMRDSVRKHTEECFPKEPSQK